MVSANLETVDNKREKKHNKRGQHLLKYAVKPGEIRNPSGRPKGSRNKLGEEFLSTLLQDFTDYGDVAIAECREQDPSAYCRIVASILPREINITDEEKLTEKFLSQFSSVEEIRAFRQQLALLSAGNSGDGQDAGERGNKAKSRKKPDRV